MAVRILLVLAVLAIFYGCGKSSSSPEQGAKEGTTEPKSTTPSGSLQEEATQQETTRQETTRQQVDKQLTGCFGGDQLQEPPNADTNSTKIAFSVNPVSEGSASASASAEQAVSLSPRPGDDGRGICVMNADGTGLMRVVNTPNSSDSLPSWTPDGKRISFPHEGVIYTMNPDGSHRARLMPVESPQPKFTSYGPMSWSPEGKKIAFESGCNIYVRSADGPNRTKRLTIGPHWQCATSPTWSPDGKRIAFVSERGTGPGLGDPPNIYITNVSRNGHTNEWRQLTDSDAGFGAVSWSPDGTEMAFVRNNIHSLTNNSTDIYKINVDSLKETRLTDSSEVMDDGPTWSPDGKKIAYESGYGISVMNADGSNQTSFVFPGGEARAPAWQPLP